MICNVAVCTRYLTSVIDHFSRNTELRIATAHGIYRGAHRQTGAMYMHNEVQKKAPEISINNYVTLL